MLKKKHKLCAFAMLAALSIPTLAYAGSSSDNISYGKMTASANLNCSWSWSYNDTAKAKTNFTSSSSTNTGYSVTSYLESRDSKKTVTQSVFDKGVSWAECNITLQDVNTFGSTHAIANSTNVYNQLVLTQLSDW